jgi:hypothetical protein
MLVLNEPYCACSNSFVMYMAVFFNQCMYLLKVYQNSCLVATAFKSSDNSNLYYFTYRTLHILLFSPIQRRRPHPTPYMFTYFLEPHHLFPIPLS